ncbi:hypothetical protein EI94DRAFT_1697535 [Lactarius quietus]|nr:hypothetical protein EI94DRAFT_1697535 [Lactarius quietus]
MTPAGTRGVQPTPPLLHLHRLHFMWGLARFLCSRNMLEPTFQDNLAPDARNQGHGQSHIRGSSYGQPIPMLPIYPGPNFWNGVFPEHSPGSAGGNSSRSDGPAGYPSATAYGQPILTGQTSEHRGAYHTPAASATNRDPLPTDYSNYPLRAAPAVYTVPNAQGEASAVWHSFCWIEHAERDEVRMTIVLRRYPSAPA